MSRARTNAKATPQSTNQRLARCSSRFLRFARCSTIEKGIEKLIKTNHCSFEKQRAKSSPQMVLPISNVPHYLGAHCDRKRKTRTMIVVKTCSNVTRSFLLFLSHPPTHTHTLSLSLSPRRTKPRERTREIDTDMRTRTYIVRVLSAGRALVRLVAARRDERSRMRRRAAELQATPPPPSSFGSARSLSLSVAPRAHRPDLSLAPRRFVHIRIRSVPLGFPRFGISPNPCSLALSLPRRSSSRVLSVSVSSLCLFPFGASVSSPHGEIRARAIAKRRPPPPSTPPLLSYPRSRTPRCPSDENSYDDDETARQRRRAPPIGRCGVMVHDVIIAKLRMRCTMP